ncbi:putative lipid phosphate phosphatase 3 [Abeliophyllum distichum]|uniref:Lipid phosphate phosphatase 3 n=1 Tax=Abeliophyllum distichum TaxID=126358 RepID=A0ABD1SFD3_9LAMI
MISCSLVGRISCPPSEVSTGEHDIPAHMNIVMYSASFYLPTVTAPNRQNFYVANSRRLNTTRTLSLFDTLSSFWVLKPPMAIANPLLLVFIIKSSFIKVKTSKRGWGNFRSTFCFKFFSCFSQSQGPETSATVTNDWFSELHFPLIKIKNHQKGMRDSELGIHTVRSHGVTVARTHMHDWLILMLLGVILAILNIIHPFYRFVGKDMMSDLKYPLKSNTVPVWLVPIYAVLLPIAVFLLFYIRRRDVYDLHHSILGLLFSVLITGVLTDAIKDAVGRPRPDYFWRCFPDGKDAYDQWGNVVCHGDKSVIREGHKSFPSGHTSWSFAGLGFLSLYLSGKIKDVFTGGLLGLAVATFCYLQFFLPPYHVDGWGTHAYFRILEESRLNVNNVLSSDAVLDARLNVNNVQSSEAVLENQQNERNNNAVIGISLSGNPSLPVEDLESGRM